MNPTVLVTILARISSILGGGVNGALQLIQNTLVSGLKAAIQFHKEGIAFARDAGMSINQARAYTEVLTQRTSDLAAKYGIAADAVKALQRNLSEATGKQIMLSDQQAEKMVQINKLVGEQTNKQFMEAMMSGMGGQLDAAQGAVSKAYATGAKQGLMASKFAEKVAQNLSMANRLSFKNGVDGVTKMVALSEKLGINLQAVETAAKDFLDINSAIENAAKMQMLGGSAAVQFGNPLTAAYEANYDPERFAQRLSDSLASYAEFDPSKGYATINGMNMDFVRAIADAMHISVDDASKMAKKQAEVQYKENRFMGDLGNMSEDRRNFILNTSQITRDASGREQLTVNGKNINEITEKEWADMMSMEGKSDSEIMKEQALHLTSIDEQLTGFKDSIIAKIAEPFNKHMGELQGAVSKIGAKILAEIEKIQPNISEMLKSITKNLPLILEWTGVIVEKVGSFLNFITKNWPILVGALIGKGLFGGRGILGGMLGGLGLGGFGGTSVGGRAMTALSSVGTRMYGSGLMSRTMGSYQLANHLAPGSSRLRNFGAALGNNLAHAPRMVKITGAAGVAMGALQGLTAVSTYNQRKDEINNSNMSEAEKAKALEAARIDKNSQVGGAVGAGVGTLLGTFFFGPLGGMIGGAVGQFAGEFIGKYWNPIVNTVKSGIKKFGDGLSWVFDKLGGLATFIWEHNPITLAYKTFKKLQETAEHIPLIGALFKKEAHENGGFIGGTGNTSGEKILSIANSKSSVTSLEANKFEYGGIVGGNSYSGDKILAGLNSKELVLNVKQQDVVAKELDGVKAKPVGGKEYIYTPRNTETSTLNGNTITVKDFNIRVYGEIKINAGNSSVKIDAKQLLDDYVFISGVKDIIKESINTDMNAGRFLNDLAVRRGQTSSSSIVGKA